MARSRVAHILSQYIHSKGHRVDTVAARMGVSESQLYKYLEGETAFPLERLGALYSATQDLDLFNDLIAAAQLGLVVTHIPADATEAELQRQVLGVNGAAGSLAETTIDALSDEQVSHAEAHEIVKRANIVVRMAQRVRNMVSRKAALA